MLAGAAMLILAFGALVMVLLVGLGDAEDDLDDPAMPDDVGSGVPGGVRGTRTA